MTVPTAQRLAAGVLGAAIVVGTALLWTGIPVATFWLAGHVTSDSVRGVLFALLAIPVAMGVGAWGLYRLNGRYESVRGEDPRPASPPSWRASLGEERRGRGAARRPPRLIDLAMTMSAVVALALFLIWFFGFADLRLSPLS